MASRLSVNQRFTPWKKVSRIVCVPLILAIENVEVELGEVSATDRTTGTHNKLMFQPFNSSSHNSHTITASSTVKATLITDADDVPDSVVVPCEFGSTQLEHDASHVDAELGIDTPEDDDDC